MATKAKSGRKVKLLRGDGADPEEFEQVGEVLSIDGPNEETSEIEATHMDSDAEEFIAGLPASGEVTFECNFVGSDAQQQALRADLRSGVLRNFKIQGNDHATTPTGVAFTAIVKGLKNNFGDVKTVQKLSVTLKISGQPVWTYAPA